MPGTIRWRRSVDMPTSSARATVASSASAERIGDTDNREKSRAAARRLLSLMVLPFEQRYIRTGIRIVVRRFRLVSARLSGIGELNLRR